MVEIGSVKNNEEGLQGYLDGRTHSDSALEEPQRRPTSASQSPLTHGVGIPKATEDEEDLSDYKEGGYHPVVPGELYSNRYRIIRKLGWGHFSTVWLARDEQAPKPHFVAIKFMRSAKHYTETARDEVEVLEKVAKADPNHPGRKHIVTLLDCFVHSGPNGQHVCMVFQVLGENLLGLMRCTQQNGIPTALVKRITKQVCLGLDYLHRVCGIIHTDLKPENVLVVIKNLDQLLETIEPQPKVASEVYQSQPLKELEEWNGDVEIDVKIADLGNGCWVNYHFSNDIQTRQYRAPEVILGSPWGASVDIWSLACMVFELSTGDYLFEPQAGRGYSKNDDHIAQIIELLGRIPLSMLLQGHWTQLYFDHNGDLRNIGRLEEWGLRDVFIDKYAYEPTKAREICDFLLPMLTLYPDRRADAGGMSNSPWLKDVGPSSEVVDRPCQGSGADIRGWASIAN